MGQNNGPLLFGRYSREECGLPPVNPQPLRAGGFLMRVFVLVTLLVAAGWLAGAAAVRYREAWSDSLPGLVSMAEPDEMELLLARGRLYATALVDSQRVRDNLVVALTIAAEKAPRRMGYYGNIAQLAALPRGRENDPQRDFAADLTASGVFAELNRYDQVFACLARADKALERYPEGETKRSHRLLLVNAQAYYLATAPLRSGGNPEKALHLSQLLISSRDPVYGSGHASDQPAFLDTLAFAWYAAGDPEKAVETQRLALGLSPTAGLDVYVEHFDTFARPGIR